MARRAHSAALLTALLLLLAAAAVAGARQEPAAAPPPKAEPRERKVPVCHYDAETDSYALLMVAVSGWQVRGQAAFIRARDAPSLCACCLLCTRPPRPRYHQLYSRSHSLTRSPRLVLQKGHSKHERDCCVPGTSPECAVGEHINVSQL